MSGGGGEDAAGSIAGLPLGEAVEAVVGRGGAADAESVRETLERVTEDGVVTEAAVDDALAHLSKVVSTPETRVELATMELEEAREAAAPVRDLEVVSSRLDGFESRLSTIEAEVARLGDDLQSLVEQRRESDRLFEVADGIARVTAEANDLQHAADVLQGDVQTFVEWVDDHGRRMDELREDVDALAAVMDDLAEAVDRLEYASGGSGPDATDDDLAAAWFDAIVEHRVEALLVADLRWELDELRRWHAREGTAGGSEAAAIEDRLDELADRRESLGDRLDGLTRRAWLRRYASSLSALDGDLSDLDPPIDWETVRSTVDAALADQAGG